MSGAAARDPDPPTVAADVARALAEDLGSGDVTAALLPDQADIAYLLCKQDAVICGRPWFDACQRRSSGCPHRLARGKVSALWPAPCWPPCRPFARPWSAPNAPRSTSCDAQRHRNVTATHVEAVRGTRARILRQRKTLPGLRLAQKYAVRVGGAATTTASACSTR